MIPISSGLLAAVRQAGVVVEITVEGPWHLGACTLRVPVRWVVVARRPDLDVLGRNTASTAEEAVRGSLRELAHQLRRSASATRDTLAEKRPTFDQRVAVCDEADRRDEASDVVRAAAEVRT